MKTQEIPQTFIQPLCPKCGRAHEREYNGKVLPLRILAKTASGSKRGGICKGE